MSQITVDYAANAMRNLGVSLNDHDSACLEFLIEFAEDSKTTLKMWCNECATTEQVKELESKSLELICRKI